MKLDEGKVRTTGWRWMWRAKILHSPKSVPVRARDWSCCRSSKTGCTMVLRRLFPPRSTGHCRPLARRRRARRLAERRMHLQKYRLVDGSVRPVVRPLKPYNERDVVGPLSLWNCAMKLCIEGDIYFIPKFHILETGTVKLSIETGLSARKGTFTRSMRLGRELIMV
jgi:hypothetical protein